MKKTLLLLASVFFMMSLSAVDITILRITGSAYSGGWDGSSGEMITKSEGVFSWTGTLKVGAFKFFNTFPTTWEDMILSGTGQTEDVVMGTTYALLHNTQATGDHVFNITEEKMYTVDVNLNTMEMVVNDFVPDFPDEIWITGSAVPNGKAQLFIDRAGATNLFRYIGELQTGEFKYMTTENETTETEYIVPVSANEEVQGETDFNLVTDKDAAGWNISTASENYKINVDFLTNKNNAEIYQSPDNVYIVGDATAIGWDAENAIPLTQDPTNPYVFVFDGELKITRPESSTKNNFKLLLQTDSWFPAISPYVLDEDITSSEYIMFSPEMDTRWSISDDKQGRYIITFDLFNETVQAEYKGNETSLNEETGSKIFVISNNGLALQLTMTNGNVAEKVEVFDITGKNVITATNATKVELTQNVAQGIYIVKVQLNGKNYVAKILN